MGLILCKTKESDKPYVIKNMGQSISSLEELCYFIYNNIYLIGSDLICDELLDFIRNDLSEPKLADNLKMLTDRNAGFSDMLSCIMRYVDYYTPEEIINLADIIESLNTKSLHERLFVRAQNLFKNGCYGSTLKNYENILNDKHDAALGDDFYGKVYHNMGVTYARLFLFKNAFKCFMEAYDLTKSEESRKEAMAAAVLYENQNAVSLMEMNDEDEFVINHEIETLMNNAVLTREYEHIKKVFATNEKTQLEELTEGFKNDYLRMTS